MLNNRCLLVSNPQIAQLYHRRREVTFDFPQMELQRRLLEQLGIDGMSSDEGEDVETGRQY